jgi:hypothetical protein
MKIEIKPTYPRCDHPEDESSYNKECWDVYLDGKLHFSTSLDRKYLEEHTIPEWIRHLNEFAPWVY